MVLVMVRVLLMQGMTRVVGVYLLATFMVMAMVVMTVIGMLVLVAVVSLTVMNILRG